MNDLNLEILRFSEVSSSLISWSICFSKCEFDL